jgi:CheY-like chemotaxis protein
MDVMTILVLEETEADLGHHQRILETIPGVRLGLFGDPAAASKIYIDQKIDVLVVDDGIPDGGLAFLKQVHLLSGRRDVPVILLVANGDKDVRRAAYEYGVYNVIEKPIDPASYLCIARNALSLQVMRRNDANNMTQVVEQMKTLAAQLEEREIQMIYGLLHTVNLVDPALSRRMVKVAGTARTPSTKRMRGGSGSRRACTISACSRCPARCATAAATWWDRIKHGCSARTSRARAKCFRKSAPASSNWRPSSRGNITNASMVAVTPTVSSGTIFPSTRSSC